MTTNPPMKASKNKYFFHNRPRRLQEKIEKVTPSSGCVYADLNVECGKNVCDVCGVE